VTADLPWRKVSWRLPQFAAQPQGRIGSYLPARLLADRKLARCTGGLERCGLPPWGAGLAGCAMDEVAHAQ
jgi:hypothetical protein